MFLSDGLKVMLAIQKMKKCDQLAVEATDSKELLIDKGYEKSIDSNTLFLKMKAIQLIKYGSSKDSFEINEIPFPNLINKDDVLIKVHAFGINFADILTRKGLYELPLLCQLY